MDRGSSFFFELRNIVSGTLSKLVGMDGDVKIIAAEMKYTPFLMADIYKSKHLEHSCIIYI